MTLPDLRQLVIKLGGDTPKVAALIIRLLKEVSHDGFTVEPLSESAVLVRSPAGRPQWVFDPRDLEGVAFLRDWQERQREHRRT